MPRGSPRGASLFALFAGLIVAVANGCTVKLDFEPPEITKLGRERGVVLRYPKVNGIRDTLGHGTFTLFAIPMGKVGTLCGKHRAQRRSGM